MGGDKSGGANQTYNYYGTLAGGICVGPVDELVCIILNGQQVWPQGKAWAVGLTITAGQLYVFDAQTWVAQTNHTSASGNAPGSSPAFWLEYTFARGTNAYDDFSITASDGTHYGQFRLYWGTTAQTVDFYLQSANNDGGTMGHIGTGDQHPDYKGICYCVLLDFLFGQEVQSGPNLEVVVRRKPNQSLITGSPAAITDGQCNLAAALVEILTDKNLLGLPTGMVDTTSFQATANYLDTNLAACGASILIDSSDGLRSVLDKIMAMVDGYIRFNSSTQKIELGIYVHGQIPTSYTQLTADQLTAIPKFSSTSWQDTKSRATVRFNSRQLAYAQTTEQVDDPRAFFVLQAVREIALDRPFITRDAQAVIHGRETLRVIGHAQTEGELQVRREFARTIRAGDYVFVDLDLEPGGAQVLQFFRVKQRKIPATGPITLSIVADNTLAPVPWNSTAPVIVPQNAIVPAITSFRVLEVPTVLAGARGNLIVLAQRPNSLIVGAQLYFDTNPSGTFSLLGTFANFAARATLHTALTTAATTLDVDVDMSQVDAAYFTQQYSPNDATNDTMLALVVAVETAPDAGQVAESGGFQVLEICSVSATSLTSAGRYALTVLRGRRNTPATAFPTANTEVWLMPRALLTFFSNAMFDVIRANRLLGTTPDHAQFRFCPFTFVSQLALSSATSQPFRFPLKSAGVPALTLTSPGGFALAYSAVTTWPLRLSVAGTWTDPDANLVQYQILLRLATDISDRVIVDQSFSSIATKTFKTGIQIDKPGSWTIKLIARDATNLITERDLTVSVTGSGAKCATVDVFDAAGRQILDADDALPVTLAAPNRFIPFGQLQLTCSTPGATIYFKTDGIIYNAGTLENVVAAHELLAQKTYAAGALQPFHGLVAGDTYTIPAQGGNPAHSVMSVLPTMMNLIVYAKAAGYTDSDQLTFQIPLFY